MIINANHIYHIYNQGNNGERIFYRETDYYVFMDFFKRNVYSFGETLAWCLMPNHFHFLIYATEASAKPVKIGNIFSTQLSNSFRKLQSIYAQHFNLQQSRTGSLFRQKAKGKCLDNGRTQYAQTVFHYIHQNPLRAGLVNSLEGWPYSSYKDYAEWTDESLCNRSLAEKLLDFDKSRIKEDSLQVLDEEIIKKVL